MSIKIRNIIAITVAALAAAAIIVIIVLASVTVKPMKYNGWLDGYENAEISVYYGGTLLQQATDENGKLIGTNDNYEAEYSYSDVIDSMNFSLFSACIQFNYDYKLRLADKSDVDANKTTVSELKEAVSGMTTESGDAVYTFVIKFNDARTLTLKDDNGAEATQRYDAAIFRLTEDSDWARMLDAYVYMTDDLLRGNRDELASTAYYKMQFGARTSTAIDLLDLIYGHNQG